MKFVDDDDDDDDDERFYGNLRKIMPRGDITTEMVKHKMLFLTSALTYFGLRFGHVDNNIGEDRIGYTDHACIRLSLIHSFSVITILLTLL